MLCPGCSSGLQENFGLTTCPSCGILLLFDLDGQVHRADEQGAPAPIAKTSKTTLAPVSPIDDIGALGGTVTIDQRGAQNTPKPVTSPSLKVAEFLQPLEPSKVIEDSILRKNENDFNEELKSYSSLPPDGQATLISPPIIDEPVIEEILNSSQNAEPKDPFQEIADFGNSEDLSKKYGSSVYVLKISGIDTADLKNQIKNVLKDPKFKIDGEILLRSMKQGQVEIPQLNAAKISMLLSQLKSLPLVFEWSEHDLL